MNLTARQQFDRAMIACLRAHPFYASILLGMRVIEDPKCGTMCTNGRDIRYAPEFVEKNSLDGNVVVLAHEALHVVQGHQLRRGLIEAYKRASALVDGKPEQAALDIKAWQQAVDCEVNHLLKDMPGFAGLGGVTAEALRLEPNRLAEWYYDHIARPPEQGPTGAGGSPQGGGTGDNGGQGQTPGRGNSGPKTGKGNGDGQGDTNGMGGVEPHPDATGDDSKDAALVQEWQQTVTRAAIAAKEAGKLPGWMAERLEEMLKPAELPWKTLLRQFATESVKAGICWNRPSRRLSHVEGFIPSRQSRTIGTLFLIEDTSGSMNAAKWHPQVCAELTAIMASFPQSSVRVLQVDTVIAHDKTFRSGETVDVEYLQTVKGRGGTDMQPAFDLAAKERPQAIICLTDGCMAWPDRCAIPTMWLLTEDASPTFGRAIRMKG